MNIVKEKWSEIIEYLRVEHELSNVSFSTWIQPLKREFDSLISKK
jgi:chromosomal replication initiator protein